MPKEVFFLILWNQRERDQSRAANAASFAVKGHQTHQPTNLPIWPDNYCPDLPLFAGPRHQNWICTQICIRRQTGVKGEGLTVVAAATLENADCFHCRQKRAAMWFPLSVWKRSSQKNRLFDDFAAPVWITGVTSVATRVRRAILVGM